MEKFNDGDRVWRTIGGRRVFIREGQSLSDAMKASGKFTKEQKKAGVEVKKADFDKDLKDMDEDELKEHLNKLESGMDDFDEDEPQYKELQKEYNEAKKALDQKSEENEMLKGRTPEEKENYYKNKAEIEKRDKMGQFEYLMEKQRERGNFKDEKSNELQHKADEVVKGMAKNKSEDIETEYSKRVSEAKTSEEIDAADKWYKEKTGKDWNEEGKKAAKFTDEEKAKLSKENLTNAEKEAYGISYTQKDLDNAKAKMLEMEGTLDDAESDPSIKRSAAYKDIKKEYNDAKAEYDKISESLRNASSDKAAKNQAVADRIMSKDKYSEYYKKENLGTPSNYKAGDKVSVQDNYTGKFDQDYTVVREATQSEKAGIVNSNLKAYILKDKNGNEIMKADNRIKSGSNSEKNSGSNKSFSSSQLSNQYYDAYFKKDKNGQNKVVNSAEKELEKVPVGTTLKHPYEENGKIKYNTMTKISDSEWESKDKWNKGKFDQKDAAGYVVGTKGGYYDEASVKAYVKSFQEYKKQHPGTKLSFNQFVDMSEGK